MSASAPVRYALCLQALQQDRYCVCKCSSKKCALQTVTLGIAAWDVKALFCRARSVSVTSYCSRKVYYLVFGSVGLTSRVAIATQQRTSLLKAGGQRCECTGFCSSSSLLQR
eukprot:793737-Pelagomonas_calceolata.AAC.2